MLTYHPDHLGSSVLISSGDGRPYYRSEMKPYGQMFQEWRAGDPARTAEGPPGTGTGQPLVNHLFTGYERNFETGYDYAQARYYDPEVARFMAVDPMVMTNLDLDEGMARAMRLGSLSVFSYTDWMPVIATDPTGMELEPPSAARGGATATPHVAAPPEVGEWMVVDGFTSKEAMIAEMRQRIELYNDQIGGEVEWGGNMASNDDGTYSYSITRGSTSGVSTDNDPTDGNYPGVSGTNIGRWHNHPYTEESMAAAHPDKYPARAGQTATRLESQEDRESAQAWLDEQFGTRPEEQTPVHNSSLLFYRLDHDRFGTMYAERNEEGSQTDFDNANRAGQELYILNQDYYLHYYRRGAAVSRRRFERHDY